MDRRNPFLLMDQASLPPSGDRPLEICMLRGEAIESRHRVHVMICDGAGEEAFRWGNPRLQFFPRSAVKLMQACTWVSRGLGVKFAVSSEELALACASHEGEPEHVRAVAAWLERLGYTEENLECGSHYPYSVASSHALIRDGKSPSQLHNNCSGKHSGMLMFCQACGWKTKGYTSYDHPVQKALRETLGQFLDVNLDEVPWGIDGCGIPTFSTSLESLAKGVGKLADPTLLKGGLQEAVRTLTAATAAKPAFIGGKESFCTKVVAESEGRVFAKKGAEGVYVAWIPQSGLGLAMKCEDGAARAAEVAMAAVLRELGHPLGFFSPLVKRWTGEVVGQFVCA